MTASPHDGDRSVAAMGERVARVETKIEGIEKDTTVIRQTMHDFAGKMQQFVALETQCVAALTAISEQTRHLPEMAARVQWFDELRPRINMVVEEHFTRKGGWRAAILIGTATMGAITMIGTIGAGVVWMLGKVVGN